MMGRTFNGGIRAGAFVAWLLWNVGIDASITVDTPRKLSVQRRQTSFGARIVGGNTARNGRYPYAQISLATDTGLHQCGGSLIAPDVILTAGHCHGFFTQIRVNIYNVKSELKSYEAFHAERMHFHPQFDELWFRYDFLLLKLNGTVQGMEPVHLNSDNSIPATGDPLNVVGWGLTDPDDSSAYPDVLKEVSVKYISNDSCEQTTSKGQRLYQGYIFDDMLCAKDDGKDACSGDSGAPLIKTGSTAEQDVVVAVVSWGNGCAGDWPGVYARISYQFQWIRDLVCTISTAPPDYFGCLNSNANTINTPSSSTSSSVVPAQAPLAGLRPGPTTVIHAPEGHVPVKVEIQLDLKSKDTGWALLSKDGTVIEEVAPGSYGTPYELVSNVVFLPVSSEFVFVIKDTQGDGICCEFGGGWFQVAVVLTDGTSGALVKGYGTFSLSSTNVFMTPADNTPLLALEGQQPQQQQQQIPQGGGSQTRPLPGGGTQPSDLEDLQMVDMANKASSSATENWGLPARFHLLTVVTTMSLLYSWR